MQRIRCYEAKQYPGQTGAYEYDAIFQNDTEDFYPQVSGNTQLITTAYTNPESTVSNPLLSQAGCSEHQTDRLLRSIGALFQ